MKKHYLEPLLSSHLSNHMDRAVTATDRASGHKRNTTLGGLFAEAESSDHWVRYPNPTVRDLVAFCDEQIDLDPDR